MNSNIERKVINNTDKIKEFEAQKVKIQAHIDYLDSLINTLDDYHKRIIELKYKYNKTSLQVATILYRTKRNINKELKKSLEELQGNIKKDPKYSQLVPTKCLKFGDYGVIIYNSYKIRVRKLTKSYSSFLLIKIDQKALVVR